MVGWILNQCTINDMKREHLKVNISGGQAFMKNTILNRVWQRVRAFVPQVANLKRFAAGEASVSWGQAGEDVLLVGFLRDRVDDASYRGFGVDIGAHHPVRWSNTKLFSDRGWRGINVDASADAVKELKRGRRRDINVNVGIGKDPGVLDYYRMSLSAMNTFSKEFAEKAVDQGFKIVDEVKVPVVTLRALLDECLPKGQHIDFMSVDCEGMDLTILQSNDWTQYRPDYVLVEIHTGGKNWEIPGCPVTRYMNEQGYEFAGQGVMTTFYKRVH